MNRPSCDLLSGNMAVAQAALDARVTLATGYPGTPSTEILEHFHALGGRAQWAPNEKVAMEVALGVAFASAAAVVTMKHVGLNVAADPFFTAAYSGVDGPLVVVVADDPGMASSQDEQDSRRYAVAAGVPMLEPADSQEAYDLTIAALHVSARWRVPVLLRMTTRVCHSKTLVRTRPPLAPRREPHFDRNIVGRVMVPAHARPAHQRLRRKLADIVAWSEGCDLNQVVQGDARLGIITSGVAFMHAREAAPEASVLKLGLTYPLPIEHIREFAEQAEHCWVIEEGDPVLFEQICAAGINVRQKPEMYRFGELNVARTRRILSDDTSPEPAPPGGKPPALCAGCPHRTTFGVLKKLDCIVAGDIGCYTLAALPPLEAMDSQLCMGASIGMGLGLRHVLPEAEARRVVSVIGDSTFIHSGITGLVEMVYNPPATGHVVVILDNDTTAMTGLQDHPGTGRTLGGEPTGRVAPEEIARAVGVGNVVVVDPVTETERFERVLAEALRGNMLTVIVVRRPCLLATAKQAKAGHQATSANQSEQTTETETPSQVDYLAVGDGPDARSSVVNVVIAGLGGQGVLTASDILAEAAVLAGLDVKKADVHGMSQRGGSVASDVRFGPKVLSPMVPPQEADILVVLADDQVENNRPRLRADGVLITPEAVDRAALPNRRSANIALLGVLSRRLTIDAVCWREAIRRHLKPELFEANCRAFDIGRAIQAD